MFGAPAVAENGQLVCVLAGPGSAVQKVIPYCKGVMGRANIDYSDQPQGKATLLKMIGNTFILNMVETLSEEEWPRKRQPTSIHRDHVSRPVHGLLQPVDAGRLLQT